MFLQDLFLVVRKSHWYRLYVGILLPLGVENE